MTFGLKCPIMRQPDHQQKMCMNRSEPAALCIALALGACIAPAALAQDAKPAPATVMPFAQPSDVGSSDAILAALYDVISGPAGTQRDWNR